MRRLTGMPGVARLVYCGCLLASLWWSCFAARGRLSLLENGGRARGAFGATTSAINQRFPILTMKEASEQVSIDFKIDHDH